VPHLSPVLRKVGGTDLTPSPTIPKALATMQ
jgi:hypothetical protein